MTTFDVNAILSSTAYGSDGDKIGKVEQVFLDDNSGEPTFLTVNTGLFGAKENFVPVKGARQDGDRVVLPYTKDVIKDAPKVDADQHLSPAEEEELYRYYELNYDDGRTAGTDRDRTTAAAGTAGVAGTAAADRGVTDRDVADRDRDAVAQDRRDVAATAGDEASVVRHEERLNVGTQEREAGHARLRKYVVTDHETVDVPVEREEVTVERTPINDTNARVDNGTIGEEEVDVTLHEERPVVQKEAVAVEEVGLNKQTVQETQRVEADVRKEQVDVETDVDRGDLGRDGEAPRR
ncbi:DUF2382 domain-containing protein [Kocuria marina]|uniref:Conserved domain-containing protein n=1 Tax=Kocuria marina subsp. indica TaxID=1049583 RepID=A0A1X7C3Z6_9MICC|nr:PRC and DUF2382 domain-containing protein [Kocuria indica]OXS85852.1 hypothetical protein B1B07_00980 [Kocuria indica]RLP59427.1 DUF2382 domain-containing protein [Kocuria indica]SME89604.1 conserved domain-containing protein [Kocuria indica]